MLLDISRCFLSIRKLKYQFTTFGLRGRAFSFSPPNECCTLSKAFEKSIAKSWHSYNPYHQVPLNSYSVFELRRPRNYSHPYTQIECLSDLPKRLSYCSDASSFKQRAMIGVTFIKPIGSQREIGIWLLQTRLWITHINTAIILFKPTRLSLLEDILIVTLVG